MDDSVRSFLTTHRTTARWLDDIFDALINRREMLVSAEASYRKREDADTFRPWQRRKGNLFTSGNSVHRVKSALAPKAGIHRGFVHVR